MQYHAVIGLGVKTSYLQPSPKHHHLPSLERAPYVYAEVDDVTPGEPLSKVR